MSETLPPADLVGIGMTTPVGLDAASAAAAIRAGICRFRETEVFGSELGALVASLVSEEYLPPAAETVPRAREAESYRRRLLQLATLALQESSAACTEPPPLLVAIPEERPWAPAGIAENLVRDLGLQAGVTLDAAKSRVYRQGGAGALFALRDALTLLASGRTGEVIVGGIDSFWESQRLESLAAEERLSGLSPDGFIPGEGAAFLVLRHTGRKRGPAPITRVLGVGLGAEKGHRYSKEPYRGEGLAQAFDDLFGRSAPSGIQCVYAGFNGESLPGKEWGVAYLRNSAQFAQGFQTEHPADCVGDTGAALGPMMIGLSAIGMQKGYRKGPCLVWSTSDEQPRAATLLASV